MAIDAMKILGALVSSGALSRGSGSNVLGSLLGAVLGGGSSSAPAQQGGGGLGDMLGQVLGGGGARPQGQGSGGMADILGGLLGGGQGGGLGSLLGSAMSHAGGAGEAAGLGLRDFGGEPDRQQAEDQALILVRAMIDAAKADGRVDENERQRVLEKLGDVSPEEAEFVRQELARPLDVEGFARSVPPEMARQVYAVSLTAIDLDTNPEARYLDQLARGLGISPEECNRIHDQLGAPRLYG